MNVTHRNECCGWNGVTFVNTEPKASIPQIDSLWESIPSWNWFLGGGGGEEGPEVDSRYKN